MNFLKKIPSLILFIIVLFFVSSALIKFLYGGPVNGYLDEDQKKHSVTNAIQVNVLNACGEDGLASQARRYLRARGFDVVEIGNYKETIEKSRVVDRLGDIRSAQKLAYTMGIEDSLIHRDIDYFPLS